MAPPCTQFGRTGKRDESQINASGCDSWLIKSSLSESLSLKNQQSPMPTPRLTFMLVTGRDTRNTIIFIYIRTFVCAVRSNRNLTNVHTSSPSIRYRSLLLRRWRSRLKGLVFKYSQLTRLAMWFNSLSPKGKKLRRPGAPAASPASQASQASQASSPPPYYQQQNPNPQYYQQQYANPQYYQQQYANTQYYQQQQSTPPFYRQLAQSGPSWHYPQQHPQYFREDYSDPSRYLPPQDTPEANHYYTQSPVGDIGVSLSTNEAIPLDSRAMSNAHHQMSLPAVLGTEQAHTATRRKTVGSGDRRRGRLRHQELPPIITSNLPQSDSQDVSAVVEDPGYEHVCGCVGDFLRLCGRTDCCYYKRNTCCTGDPSKVSPLP
ncbi:hypothetical protein F4861DRAFT_69323 [Xylaria intraflava]|nr:hypothetical protein F4861DRAFT_69323 [Xylaria intraflava]